MRYGKAVPITLVAVTGLGAAVVACSVSTSSGNGTVDGGMATDSSPDGESGVGSDDGSADAVIPEVIGCDAGTANTGGCGYLDVMLSGGFTASDCCYGCGSDVSGFSWEIDQDRASFQIDFPQGQTPLLQTGTFALESAAVTEGYGDGGVLGWQTPPGACAVTITRSVCAQAPSGGQKSDWIQGSGHCMQPAGPTAAKGPATPVTIGDFSFRGYVLFP
jgi:hypothetical protein